MTGQTEVPDWVKSMPAYHERGCDKCGGAMSPKFYPLPEPERLLWTCARCGAQRYTKPKDAPSPYRISVDWQTVRWAVIGDINDWTFK